MKIRNLLFAAFYLMICNLAFAQYDDYMKVVAEPPSTAFVMYAANNGDLYYTHLEGGYLDLMKYDNENDEVVVVAENFVDRRYESNTVYNNGFGAVATTLNRDTVYCMTTAGSNHGRADIFKLVCSEDSFEPITKTCGTNYWMYWNMSLSPDGSALYYIGNNTASGKAVYKIDIASKECSNVLDLDPIIGARDLCFGGINVWDQLGNFYVPVWTYQQDDNDTGLLQVNIGGDEVTGRLLHFTDDLTEGGDRLFPGFRHESCWDAITSSSNGDVYICVSNHLQPRDASQTHGNVVIYKYDPVEEEMTLLDDIKSVSTEVNNWMSNESQYKVHTFMIENADGKIYFATGEHHPTYFLRGSHIYTIDINTDKIEDYSKNQTYLMKKDLSVIENTHEATTTSGVFIEHYGIKGIALNPNYPEYLYAMTWEMLNGAYLKSYIVKYKIDGVIADIMPLNAPENEVVVFPNPFVENVSFDFSKINSQGVGQLSIFDLQGRLVLQEEINTQETINLNIAESGSKFYLYTVEIDGEIYRGKLIKQ